MGKIFKSQTELRIKLKLGENISDYSSVLVKYKKPSGTRGEWSAVVATAIDGTIYYDIASSSDLDESGDWKFWGAVTLSDGDYIPGESVRLRVYDEGDK